MGPVTDMIPEGSGQRESGSGQEGRNICSTFPGPGWPGALMGWQRRSQRQDKLERDSYGAVAAMDATSLRSCPFGRSWPLVHHPPPSPSWEC